MRLRQYLLGLIAIAASSAQAGKKLADMELDAKTGTRIELNSVFDPMPPSGYAPVRIVGTNGTAKAALWVLNFEYSASNYSGKDRYSSEFALEVGARSTASSTLLVPLAAGYGQGTRSGMDYQLQIHLNAGERGNRDFHVASQNGELLPAIAISKVLADSSGSALKDEVAKRGLATPGGWRGSTLFGSEFHPEELPEDWRGFSGFDVLMITNGEWSSLKSGARLAILQWVRLGGKMHIYVSPGSNPAGLGISADVLDGRRDLSLGKVGLISWNGERLNAVETVGRYWDGKEREKELVEGYTAKTGGDPQWGLMRSLGKRSFASWQVLVFLVVFGILVGPINLFVLAPASRRHRLFVTTPLLSLGASVLMIGILLFQDGIGGHGRRFVAVDVEPGDAAAYVTQEQVCRTGLLVSAGFEMKQTALVEPLALPDTPWVKLKNDYKSQGVQITQNGPGYSGNIFQSRAEQGQLLHAVISARARLELKPATTTAPEMVSALGFTANEMFYVDGDGKVWKSAAPAVTGQAVKFSASDPVTLQKWWKEACSQAGERTRERLERQLTGARDVFFAKAAAAPEFTLDTLKSIRWADDQVVIFGAVPKP